MNVSLAPGLGGAIAVCPSNHHALQFSNSEDATPEVPQGGKAIAVEAVRLRHLKTRPEIERILHLRDAIDLSVHSAAADFRSLEKKEMSAASSGHSNCRGES